MEPLVRRARSAGSTADGNSRVSGSNPEHTEVFTSLDQFGNASASVWEKKVASSQQLGGQSKNAQD